MFGENNRQNNKLLFSTLMAKRGNAPFSPPPPKKGFFLAFLVVGQSFFLNLFLSCSLILDAYVYCGPKIRQGKGVLNINVGVNISVQE